MYFNCCRWFYCLLSVTCCYARTFPAALIYVVVYIYINPLTERLSVYSVSRTSGEKKSLYLLFQNILMVDIILCAISLSLHTEYNQGGD